MIKFLGFFVKSFMLPLGNVCAIFSTMNIVTHLDYQNSILESGVSSHFSNSFDVLKIFVFMQDNIITIFDWFSRVSTKMSAICISRLSMLKHQEHHFIVKPKVLRSNPFLEPVTSPSR